MKYAFLAIVISFAGCVPNEMASYGDNDLSHLIAVEIAYATLQSTPSPAPSPSEKHSRSDCPHGGWLTAGDGHRYRCPDCDPPWNDGLNVQVNGRVTTIKMPPRTYAQKRQDALSTGKPLVLLIGAPDCVPCMLLLNKLKEKKIESRNDMIFHYFNAREEGRRHLEPGTIPQVFVYWHKSDKWKRLSFHPQVRAANRNEDTEAWYQKIIQEVRKANGEG